MKKFAQIMVSAVALLAFSVAPLSAQEYGITITKKANHFTTNTTYTPVSQTCTLYTLVVQCSTAGTTEIITVKDKGGTAKTLYVSPTLTAPLTVTFQFPVGILMSGGIDVVYSGGGAGVVDVWVSYK